MKMVTTSNPTLLTARQPTINPLGLALVVLFFAYVGMVFVQRFGNIEEQRELLNWQNKLGLIADSRTADVDGWFDRHFKELGDVAVNPSLQLYLTTLMNPNKPESKMPPGIEEEPAQAVFLRNLLVMTADRMGFNPKMAPEVSDIKANVPHPMGAGLAIVDMQGKLLVTTRGLGALEGALAAKVASAPRGKPSLQEVFDGKEGNRIAFVIPIYPIQSDNKPDQQIARLIGVKPLGEEFFRLLVQPGVSDKTLEALLLRKQDGNVEYIGINSAAGRQTNESLALTTPELDASFAITSPGVFAQKLDQQSNPVLMISRALKQVPWVLMLHIDRNQALEASDNWRGSMKFAMAFGLFALISMIVAAWWYGSSRRATLLSQQTAKLAAFSMAQEKLLRVVSDNQPEAAFIVDNKKVFRFANQKTAERFKQPIADITGKSMVGVMGTDLAKAYGEANDSVLVSHQPLSRTHRIGVGIESRTFTTTHVPLEHVPVEGLSYPTPGVLVVDKDITEIVVEKERRERILHQLINTLVRMVDARDPYSANHSQAVSIASREVAQSLGLAPVLVETARISGKIMNIGKIMVPTEILTKRKALEKDEQKVIQEGMSRTVALLQGIEFDGPVVNTLRQCYERIDGTGPLGLKSEDILITARIIAAANSFVGMISPRSYRDPLGIELATGTLLQNVDKQFDRKVVVALINFVENKKGRETLLALVEKKAA